jgi:spermidine synthase
MEQSVPQAPVRAPPYLALFLLSAATLAYEINLTRLYAVSQFYHFAFLVVSIAMFGSGAGGTLLAVSAYHSRLTRFLHNRMIVPLCCLATSLAMTGAFLLMNWAPFDSFLVGVKPGHLLLLGLHYLVLSLPFFFAGIAFGILLQSSPARAGSLYAANLVGSAAGCWVVLLSIPALGGEGVVVLCSFLSAIAAIIFLQAWQARVMALIWIILLLPDLGWRLAGGSGYPMLTLQLSPYKSLSYALQVPGAQVVSCQWNTFSRVDRVHSAGIHSLPGLSFRYLGALPIQDGLLVDGDDLYPILLPPNESQAAAMGQNTDLGLAGFPGLDLRFTNEMLLSLAFDLRPQAKTLVLDGRGGLDGVLALANGASQVAMVESNPAVIEAAPYIYQQPGVVPYVEIGRSYLARSQDFFDVVVFSLTNSYHPVRSGAYSLAEDYRYTLESFGQAFDHLKPGGLLAAMRWLQNPPSDELRLLALVVETLERKGKLPEEHIAALRSYNAMLFLVNERPFTPGELQTIRQFATGRAFDLVTLPGLQPGEINQFNILPEPVYEQRFAELLQAKPRDVFYQNYPFDVRPPTDNRPFFGHFFKWEQAGSILAELGKTWQPFGGAGYFVILVLLAFAMLCAAGFILLPAFSMGRGGQRKRMPRQVLMILFYFGMIGLAFMLVEVPLIQRFIVYLGNPTYAISGILFTILLFSGIGSQVSSRIRGEWTLVALAGLLILVPLMFPWMIEKTLGWGFTWRMLLTGLMLAPIGFLMGMPFPNGIRQLVELDSTPHPPWIGWAWAVNGAASVLASMLAALLAISLGFQAVFLIGAACYAAAWVVLNLVGHSRLTSKAR